ncbi:MAG: tetratricopeptide repeat protein [Acidobacteria bacterium]|nr:tetratricopeptide repeat protein [Acidobacteriota bacterium]
MLGAEYCFVHYPKRAPIVALVVGALLSVAFQAILDSWTLSDEEKRIIALNGEVKGLQGQIQVYQAENSRLKAELDAERSKTFELSQNPGPSGGIRVYSKRAAAAQHYADGLAQYKAGDLRAAKATFELMVQQVPNDAESWNMLGIVLHELGHPDQAIECIEKAYALTGNPDFKNNLEVVRRFPGKRVRFTEKP